MGCQKTNGKIITGGIYTHELNDVLKSLSDLIKKKMAKKEIEKKSKTNKKVLRVTFEYSEDGNTKSLKSSYGGNYTQEEYETLLTYIIDSILPTSYLSVVEQHLGDAWNDYKHERKRGKI